ncbi:hypothetical protein [Flagellimonas sp.]|uniref:hypothetical protein n=1 Tax=Flagellimonas sp. TaxID=2058762 RepID=UPI003B5966AC
MSNILGEINNFLEKGSINTMEITFAQLEIDTYHNGEFLKRIQKPNCSIILHRSENNTLAKMDVVDNIAFRFSFRFAAPTSSKIIKAKCNNCPDRSHKVFWKWMPKSWYCSLLLMLQIKGYR